MPFAILDGIPAARLGITSQSPLWKRMHITYGDLAKEIGHPKSSRAVGTALGGNKLPICCPVTGVIRGDLSVVTGEPGLRNIYWASRGFGKLCIRSLFAVQKQSRVSARNNTCVNHYAYGQQPGYTQRGLQQRTSNAFAEQ